MSRLKQLRRSAMKPRPRRSALLRRQGPAVRHYPALIYKEARSCYGVVFPDLPGCTSAGDTLEDALMNAHDAVQAHVEICVEHRESVAEPTPIERLKIGATDRKGLVHVQLVPIVMPGRAVKVMISLEGGLLSRIDAKAGPYGRSQFIAEAARAKLSA